MAQRVKFGKIAIVVFITALIWIWADLALDEDYTITGAQIKIGKKAPSDLWISFDGKFSSPIESIEVKGPTSRISNLRQKVSQGDFPMEFFIIPQEHGIDRPGPYPIDVASVVRSSDRIRRIGLVVTSCKPRTVSVNAEKLVEKSLDLKAVDENDSEIRPETIEPSKVRIQVPKDWLGPALVKLNSVEIKQARSEPVKKTPFVNMPGGKTITASEQIEVKMPVNTLKSATVSNVGLGITYSLVLQGKYKVEVLNQTEVMSPIVLKGTPQAVNAYENMRYQVILEIDDSYRDTAIDKPQREGLIYNFPHEYVEKGEISLYQQPVNAQFKLIPLETSEEETKAPASTELSK